MKPWGTEASCISTRENPARISTGQARRYRYILASVALLVQILCALVITQYDASHAGFVRHPLPSHICFPSKDGSCIRLPGAIRDPSAVVFTNSIMTYATAVMTVYIIYKDDGFQDQVIVSGSILGLLIASLVAIFEGDIAGPIKDYMPGFITLSFLANLSLQWAFGEP